MLSGQAAVLEEGVEEQQQTLEEKNTMEEESSLVYVSTVMTFFC